MREAGLQGVSPHRPRSSTRRDNDAEPAPDLVKRDFTADAPNQLRVADITLVPTGEGPWWLASIRDAFSRRTVGRHTSERADADLVLTSLEYALHGRPVQPGQLVHHSGHGGQYTSIKLTTRLLKAGIEPSMGRVGDSYGGASARARVGRCSPDARCACRPTRFRAWASRRGAPRGRAISSRSARPGNASSAVVAQGGDHGLRWPASGTSAWWDNRQGPTLVGRTRRTVEP